MRPSAFFGMLACAVALGATIIGRFVILPGIGASDDLIDANLAKALSAPIHLRMSEVILAASLVAAALAGRWLRVGWASTIALVAVAAAAAMRFALLPAMYASWSKADLVAGRPMEHILAAQRLEAQEMLLASSIVALHVVLLFVASMQRGAAVPKVSSDASSTVAACAPPLGIPVTQV